MDTRPPRSISNEPLLTVPDTLEAFDRWNDGDCGPAYGTIVLFNAHRASLEKLTRDVLLDRGLDPERWRECTDTVEAAFKEWLVLDAPYVRPADPGPGVRDVA
jgi:hypothetical protein